MKLLALILAMTVCACVNNDNAKTSTLTTITIGVLPDQSSANLLARYAPLLDYLEAATALHIDLSIASDYQELLDDFDAGRLHLANFGGLTFVQAEQRSRAIPLVMRDVDLRFTSCYLVAASDARRSVADFEGEAFAFGPKLSTSGHLMPRHFLTASELIPEHLFSSIIFSDGHDQTATLVSDGIVAIGVANCEIIRAMSDNGSPVLRRLRILETTPPYADYVWAISPSLDASVKNLLRDAFLALDPAKPEHRAVLRTQGAGGYLPAGRGDFDDVRTAAREIDMLFMKELN